MSARRVCSVGANWPGLIAAMAHKTGRKPRLVNPQTVWGRVNGSDNAEILRLAQERGVTKSEIVSAMLTHCLTNLPDVDLPSKATQQQEALQLKAS